MNIVIATEGKEVAEEFDSCKGYTIYEIKNREVKSNKYELTPGSIPIQMPKWLEEKKVDVVIAGSAGPVATSIFKEQGIIYILGVSGKVKEVIDNYLKCELKAGKTD